MLTERSSARVFLKDGTLQGAAGKAQVESVKDPVFKSGKRIVVPRAGGGSVSLELYRDLPFLLVRGELRNDSPAVTEVTTLSPTSFELDLGRAVERTAHHGHRRTDRRRQKPRQLPVPHPGRSGHAPRRGGRLADQRPRQRRALLRRQGRQGPVQGADRLRPPAIPSRRDREAGNAGHRLFRRRPTWRGAVCRRHREALPTSSSVRRSPATARGTPTSTAGRATRSPSSNWPSSRPRNSSRLGSRSCRSTTSGRTAASTTARAAVFDRVQARRSLSRTA